MAVEFVNNKNKKLITYAELLVKLVLLVKRL
jgi:hypothetical protein